MKSAQTQNQLRLVIDRDGAAVFSLIELLCLLVTSRSVAEGESYKWACMFSLSKCCNDARCLFVKTHYELHEDPSSSTYSCDDDKLLSFCALRLAVFSLQYESCLWWESRMSLLRAEC